MSVHRKSARIRFVARSTDRKPAPHGLPCQFCRCIMGGGASSRQTDRLIRPNGAICRPCNCAKPLRSPETSMPTKCVGNTVGRTTRWCSRTAPNSMTGSKLPLRMLLNRMRCVHSKSSCWRAAGNRESDAFSISESNASIAERNSCCGRRGQPRAYGCLHECTPNFETCFDDVVTSLFV